MNQFQLSAQISQIQALRYTPAGVPALNLFLEHDSSLSEMGRVRQVKLQVKAVAFGIHAQSLSNQPLGSVYKFDGFLTNDRSGKGLLLHIRNFSNI